MQQAHAIRKMPFWKMDGTGNEFVILDARAGGMADELPTHVAAALASRENPDTGGCDQLILIGNSTSADCFMRIYNTDGSESGACGNATRCVAWLLARDGSQHVTIETLAGILTATVEDISKITVDMGKPRIHWQEIPLSEQRDTLHLGLELGPLSDPVGVSMGNPHAVFFVPDPEAVDLAVLGPQLEHHALFPERANIGVASVHGNEITLRVWERGAGETLACGTGACAAFVAAQRRELLPADKEAIVKVHGGELRIRYAANGHVLMQGPARLHGEGIISL